MSTPITEAVDVSPAGTAQALRDWYEAGYMRDNYLSPMQSVLLMRAIHTIEDLERSQTASGCEGWRTVESGMPPPNVWVYIYCGKAQRVKDRRQYVACRHEYGHKRRMWLTSPDDEWGVAGSVVTHWKPMQENPK
jgi:hypothetical protein